MEGCCFLIRSLHLSLHRQTKPLTRPLVDRAVEQQLNGPNSRQVFATSAAHAAKSTPPPLFFCSLLPFPLL